MLKSANDGSKRPLRTEVRTSEKTREFARQLRGKLSPPERVLWSSLKGQKLAGLKFRRQHSLGPWTADFYCHEAALVVEIDGAGHRDDRKRLDGRRDAWMIERGVCVLRVTANDVLRNLDGVLRAIRRRAEERIAELRLSSGKAPPPSLADS